MQELLSEVCSGELKDVGNQAAIYFRILFPQVHMGRQSLNHFLG